MVLFLLLLGLLLDVTCFKSARPVCPRCPTLQFTARFCSLVDVSLVLVWAVTSS